MFIPNRFCHIRKRHQAFNAYGEPKEGYGEPTLARCGIVKLVSGDEKTSVRTDSSASRGNADEIVADARLLFKPLYDIGIGDMVIAEGVSFKIESIHPRIAVFGVLDHWQVDCSIMTLDEEGV